MKGGPKSSLRPFLHRALQLIELNSQVIGFKSHLTSYLDLLAITWVCIVTASYQDTCTR